MPIDPDFLVPGGALTSPLFERAFGESALAPGTRVGPYRVVRELGRGGMGVVYLAERADGEFEQTVALKLVSADADAATAEELLRRERQMLAGLQHPGIARLLDGGSDAKGNLWFALEFVEGTRIDDYCEQLKIPRARRLRLFASVCDAVQFAHGRLLIHRDIKPANILVTREETTRLLDFGIAQLLHPDEDADAAPTARALTPGYASPEQTRGDPASTASDIYQLGLLLQRVLGSAEDARDLRAIISKATRQQAEARYATVAELRADIENFLALRPVLARGGAAYRAGRFLHRHALSVVALAAIAIVFAATIAAFTLGLASERDQARAAELRAQLESQRATRINDFLAGIFRVADPGANRGDRLTATQLLDRGAADAENRLAAEPETVAGLLGVIGEAYLGLGDYVRAETPLTRALELRHAAKADARELAHSLRMLGWLRHKQARYDDALALFDEALGVLGDKPEARSEISAVLDEKSLAQKHRGDTAGAIVSAQAAVAAARAVGDDDRLVTSLDHLALLYYVLDRDADAERVYAEALALTERVFGERDAHTISVRENYASALAELGRGERAEAMMRGAIDAEQALYGADNQNVIESMVLLGNLQTDIERVPEAIATYRRALDMSARSAGANPETIASLHANLGSALVASGSLTPALAEFDAAIDLYKRNHSTAQYEIAHVHDQHAAVLHSISRDAESEAELRGAINIYAAQLPPEHRYRLLANVLLAEIVAARGDRDQALELLRQTLPALDRIDSPDKAAAKQAHVLFDNLSTAPRETNRRTGG
jgi:eukaryotic-like serine/threonine-protein kinase